MLEQLGSPGVVSEGECDVSDNASGTEVAHAHAGLARDAEKRQDVGECVLNARLEPRPFPLVHKIFELVILKDDGEGDVGDVGAHRAEWAVERPIES